MIDHGTLSIPEASSDSTATSLTELDQAMQELSDARDTWLDMPIAGRVDLLRELRSNVAEVADRWVAAACEAKGIEPGSPAEGEEWQAGPWLTMRCLRLMEASLTDLAAAKKPELPGKVRRRRRQQTTVPVFPTDIWDRVLFTGFSGKAVMQPGISPDDVVSLQASAYESPQPSTCVILGAGNVSSIAPTDALTKMFGELKTVMLKLNPVNDYIGPFLAEAFAPLIQRNVLRLAYGGSDVGKHLTTHDLADSLHMTGSDKTHDAIVFGTGDEGARNKAAGTPINTRPMTAELGNVTPVIVVPGPWRDRDFAYQGTHLASMLTNNAGFNCIASRVMIQHEGWDGRTRVLDAIKAALSTVRSRSAYYPGAEDRWKRFTDAHPDAQRIGLHEEGRLPWTVIENVDADDTDDICLTTEAFASVVAEVGLEAPDVATFVERAVEFANETIWGTLGVTILVHPRSGLRTKRAVRRAVASLEYGTVAINQWSALGFAYMSAPWGAYPGAEATDIRSGRGFVHNTYLLSGVEKSVVRGPWRVRPKAAWFVNNRTALQTLRALTRFEAKPGLWRLLRTVVHAIRG